MRAAVCAPLPYTTQQELVHVYGQLRHQLEL